MDSPGFPLRLRMKVSWLVAGFGGDGFCQGNLDLLWNETLSPSLRYWTLDDEFSPGLPSEVRTETPSELRAIWLR
jgi:hypothetical protein